MQSTTTRPYQFEGNLFVSDITQDLISTDFKGQLPQDFQLDEKAKLADEIAAAWAIAKANWAAFQQSLDRLPADDVATSVTRNKWAIPLLMCLGYAPILTNAETIDNQSYAISHRVEEGEAKPPLHIVGCRVGLEKRPPSGTPRISAHGLMQEYLNRTEHLWGVVTNGYQWRLLRDSNLITRLTYVEFDLQQILNGENFAEFGLFYRLFHRSRLPQGMDDADKCLLEYYHQQTLQQGGRVRDKLRDGVESAIERLGNGFLEHPKNDKLRAKCAAGEINPTEYYRQLLMLIYRLLFLMVAESRDLMLTDGDPEQRRIYQEYYSVERLRRLAERPSFQREGFQDLWLGLLITFKLFDENWRGRVLGLSPLNGDLFGSTALSYIDDYAIDNYDLLRAIWDLSLYEHQSSRGQAKQLRRVNYEALDVEELGSIYESLLDFHPQILLPLTPLLGGVPVGRGGFRIFRFELIKGSDRKSTGSYYTPPELVAQLIKTALEPVITEKLSNLTTIPEKEAALLSITICDPSCGSGHFLLAAARRLGKELARVRTGEHQPGLEHIRPATRDVIQNCIYGVDLNPLAVDLCKVALWIEGYNKGYPLSFLDHRIKCGNSLVGVMNLDCLKEGIPEGAYTAVTGDNKAVATKLKKRNKEECKQLGQQNLFDTPVIQAERDRYTQNASEIGLTSETTASDVRAKQERYRASRRDSSWYRDYTLCNLWTAAFFMPLISDLLPTTETLDRLMSKAPSQAVKEIADTVNQLAVEKFFFHWCLEFPEVFQDGGFSCILGNPPWERIKLQEQEFFAARDAEIANAQNTAVRERLIKQLPLNNPELLPILENEVNEVNPWGISFMRMLDMSNDSELFQDYPNEKSLPLYEGKMFQAFDRRAASVIVNSQNRYRSAQPLNIDDLDPADPHFQIVPRYWVDQQQVDNKLAGKWDKQWLLAFRDITDATNERTSIVSLLPKAAVGHTAPLILTKIDNIRLLPCLLGNLNALTFDFVTRNKIGGKHMTFTVVRQLPVLPPESYTPQDIEFISSRVLELVYTAWDMQPFAQDMGYEGAPFVWNPERRAILRAELDAKYAKLYGLTRDELRYILDPSDVYGEEFPSETFRVLRDKEMKEYGEYRTQRLVLAAWDLLESSGQMLS